MTTLPNSLAYRGYQLLWSGLDWIFPPRCAGCGKVKDRFCQDCWKSVVLIQSRVCTICGQPLFTSDLCNQCSQKRPSFSALRSWAQYSGPLRQAILRLKYRRDLALGDVLAAPLIQFFRELDWEVDCVIPVPISLVRLRERGYNQVSLIALPLALALGIPYLAKGLKKTRETRSQVGLSAEERTQNVFQAFEADSGLVSGRRVLVVDDVITTGATMEACAFSLKEAGALEVYGITLARAMLE